MPINLLANKRNEHKDIDIVFKAVKDLNYWEEMNKKLFVNFVQLRSYDIAITV